MPAKTNHRNHRNNPYVFDDFAVKFHRTVAGVLWRWRTELAGPAAGLLGFRLLTDHLAVWLAAALMAGLVVLLAGLPWTRRWLTGRFWCLVSRHRLQRLCYEARLHTRTGRLPLILWIRPTPVGERAWLWCRAGICVEDFEAHLGEIRGACYARDARCDRNRRWSQLVTIEIIRRDPLTAGNVISSPLARPSPGGEHARRTA